MGPSYESIGRQPPARRERALDGAVGVAAEHPPPVAVTEGCLARGMRSRRPTPARPGLGRRDREGCIGERRSGLLARSVEIALDSCRRASGAAKQEAQSSAHEASAGERRHLRQLIEGLDGRWTAGDAACESEASDAVISNVAVQRLAAVIGSSEIASPVALVSDGIKPVATSMLVPPRQFRKQHRCAIDGTRDRHVTDAVVRLAPRRQERAGLVRRAGVEAAAVESIGGDFRLRRLDQREQIAAGGQIPQEVRRVNSLCCGRPGTGGERDDDEGVRMSRDYSISLAGCGTRRSLRPSARHRPIRPSSTR